MIADYSGTSKNTTLVGNLKKANNKSFVEARVKNGISRKTLKIKSVLKFSQLSVRTWEGFPSTKRKFWKFWKLDPK